MRVLEIDRRAQGTPDAFTEPPPGARAAIPKLNKAMQKRDSRTAARIIKSHIMQTEKRVLPALKRNAVIVEAGDA